MQKKLVVKFLSIIICLSLLLPNFAGTAQADSGDEAVFLERSNDPLFGYWVKYSYRGQVWRSDQAGAAINLRAWEAMSETDKRLVTGTFTSRNRVRRDQFGDAGSASMAKWVNDVTGWTQAQEIWQDRVAARDFPELQSYYTQGFNQIIHTRNFTALPASVRGSSTYKDWQDEIRAAQEEFELGKAAYDTLVQARARQIGNAFRGGSKELIPIIVNTFMTGHITRGAHFVSGAIADGFGFVMSTINKIRDEVSETDPNEVKVADILEDLWKVILKLEDIANGVMGSLDGRQTRISSLEDQIDSLIENAQDEVEAKREEIAGQVKEVRDQIAAVPVPIPHPPFSSSAADAQQRRNEIREQIRAKENELRAEYHALVAEIKAAQEELWLGLGGTKENRFKEIAFGTYIGGYEFPGSVAIPAVWGSNMMINALYQYTPQEIFNHTDYQVFKSSYSGLMQEFAQRKKDDAERLEKHFDEIRAAVDGFTETFKSLQARVLGLAAQGGNSFYIYGSVPEQPLNDLASLVHLNTGSMTIIEAANSLREQADAVDGVKSFFYSHTSQFESMVQKTMADYGSHAADLELALQWLVQKGDALKALHQGSPYIIPLGQSSSDPFAGWGSTAAQVRPTVGMNYIQQLLDSQPTPAQQEQKLNEIIKDLTGLRQQENELLDYIDTAEGHIRYHQQALQSAYQAMTQIWGNYWGRVRFPQNLSYVAGSSRSLNTAQSVINGIDSSLGHGASQYLFDIRRHSSNTAQVIASLHGQSEPYYALRDLRDQLSAERSSLINNATDADFGQKLNNYTRLAEQYRSTGMWVARTEMQKQNIRTAHLSLASLVSDIIYERYYTPVSGVVIRDSDNQEISALEMQVGSYKSVMAVVTPSGATVKGVTWTSSHPSSVSVTPLGQLYAQKATPQSVTITATSVDNSSVSASISVSVVEPPPPGDDGGHYDGELRVEPAELSLLLAETGQLNVYYHYDHGYDWDDDHWDDDHYYDLPYEDPQWFNWTSSNPGVASVTPDGIVTAHSPGVAYIKVLEIGFPDDWAAYCRVTVTDDGSVIVAPPSLVESEAIPAPGVVSGNPRPTISITVNEGSAAIDLDNSYMTLLRNGVEVATVGYASGQLRFSPPFDLVEAGETGEFEVNAYVVDLNGDADEFSWFFSIDAVAPVLEATVNRLINSDNEEFRVSVRSDKPLAASPTAQLVLGSVSRTVTLTWDSVGQFYSGAYRWMQPEDLSALKLDVSATDNVGNQTALSLPLISVSSNRGYVGLDRTAVITVSSSGSLPVEPKVALYYADEFGMEKITGAQSGDVWNYSISVNSVSPEGKARVMATWADESGHIVVVERAIIIDRQAHLARAYHTAPQWINQGETFRVLATAEQTNVEGSFAGAGLTAIFDTVINGVNEFPMQPVGSAGVDFETGVPLTLYSTVDIVMPAGNFDEAIEVRLIDRAGNEARTRTETPLRADSAPPSLSSISADTLLKDGDVFNLSFESSKPLDLSRSSFSIGQSIVNVRLSAVEGRLGYTGQAVVPEGLALHSAPVTVKAVDKAGNTVNANVGQLTVLNRPPVVRLSGINGTLGWNDFYRSPVEVFITIDDADTTLYYWYYEAVGDSVVKHLSEVLNSSAGQQITVNWNVEGNHQIFFMAEDAVGNRTQEYEVELNLLLTPPAEPGVMVQNTAGEALVLSDGVYQTDETKAQISVSSVEDLVGIYQEINGQYHLVSRLASGESLQLDLALGTNKLHVKSYSAAGVPSEPVPLDIEAAGLSGQDSSGEMVAFDAPQLPTLTLVSPVDGAVISTVDGVVDQGEGPGVLLQVDTDHGAVLDISLNGQPVQSALTVTDPAGHAEIFIPLNHASWIQDSLQPQQLTVTATNDTGTRMASVGVLYDVTLPQLTLYTPQDSSHFAVATLAVTGSSDPLARIEVEVDGQTYSAFADSAGSFSVLVSLQQGANQLTVVAIDASGNRSEVIARQAFLGSTAPVISTTLPALTASSALTVQGALDRALRNNGLRISLNGAVVSEQTPAAPAYGFTSELALVSGSNTVELQATDMAGNRTTETYVILYDPALPVLTVGAPAATPHQIISVTGTGIPGAMVDIYVGGQLQSTNQIPENGEFDIPVTLLTFDANNTIQAIARGVLEGLSWTSQQEVTVLWHDARVSFRGKIINPVGLSLADVQVVAVKDSVPVKTVFTDGNGEYNVADLEAGEYILHFSKDGYVVEPQTPVMLSSGDEHKLDATMALRGDVNLDGFVNAADIVPINRHALGLETITDPLSLLAADVNGDGFVNAADIVPVNRHALGIELLQ